MKSRNKVHCVETFKKTLNYSFILKKDGVTKIGNSVFHISKLFLTPIFIPNPVLHQWHHIAYWLEHRCD